MTSQAVEGFVYTPSAQIIAEANAIREQAKLGRLSSQAVLARAFGLYRTVVVNGLLTAASAPGWGPLKLLGLTDLFWLGFTPYLEAMAQPVLIAELVKGGITNPAVQAIYADSWTERVGKYFNTSAKQAMRDGTTYLMNKKTPGPVAARRVAETFGLTPRQTRAYVAMSDGLSVATVTPIDRGARSRSYISRSFADRMKVFGREEIFRMRQEIKDLSWEQQLAEGTLPEHAKKIWITARDEKVCKVCGPMHLKTVGVRDAFTLPDGSKTRMPGVHVNCRCSVRIKINTMDAFGKADTWREELYRRDNSGRFAPKPNLKEKSTDDTARLINETFLRPTAPQKAELKSTKLSSPSLKSSELKTSQLKGSAPLKSGSPLKSGGSLKSRPDLKRGNLKSEKGQLARQGLTQRMGNLSPAATKLASAAAAKTTLNTEVYAPERTVFRETIRHATPLFGFHNFEALDHDPREMVIGDISAAAQLSEEDVFYDNPQRILAQLESDFGSLIDLGSDVITDSIPAMWDDDDIEPQIDWEQASDVSYAIATGIGLDQTFEIKMVERGPDKSQVGVEIMTAREIAEMAGLDEEHFVQFVYRMPESYSDAHPEKYGRETEWTVPGEYDAVVTEVAGGDGSLPLIYIDLIPRVDDIPLTGEH